MIFKILCATLLITAGTTVHSQTINGDWQGILSVQSIEIPIVFHIRDSAGSLSASFDSPKQQAFNLPCNGAYATADSLVLTMDILKGGYEGRFNSDRTTVTGTWRQGTASLPLTINKISSSIKLTILKRPQTPKPPFPYLSEEVSYYNSDESVRFMGTFTRPKAASGTIAKYPVVLLISGSGPQDRDETIIEHKPFAVIADYLSRNGFAVLRVDDRGTGKTSGNFSTATSADFAADAEAGLNYLKAKKDIDAKRIGLLGHSEGAMIAPVIAARRKEVTFMVLLAGPGVPIIQLMREQVEAVDASAGYPALAVKADGALYSLIAAEVLKTADRDSLKTASLKLIETWAAATDTATLNALHLNDVYSRRSYVANQLPVLSSPWFRYFLAFDPQPYLRQTTAKVLALNGSRDIQVTAAPNLTGIRSALQKSASPKYEVIERPGLNHLFQNCKTCTAEEYGELEETFDAATLKLIADWLRANVK